MNCKYYMNINIKCLLCAEYYGRHWDYGNEIPCPHGISSLMKNTENPNQFQRVEGVNRKKVKCVMRAYDGTFSKPRKDWGSFPRRDYSYKTSEMSKGELGKGE